MNRITRVDYADGSYTTYSYDNGSRLLSVSDSVSGTISYTYSDTGCGVGCGSIPDKIASETTPLGVVNYTYDAVGRRTSMTVLGQSVVNYDYYDNGWIENIRQVVSGVEQKFNFVRGEKWGQACSCAFRSFRI